MITIKYGDAVITTQTALLNETLNHELQCAELKEKGSDLAVIQLIKLQYEYFASKIISVVGLFYDDKEISLQDIKELKVPSHLMAGIIKAHGEAQRLALEAEEQDPKKN